MSSLLAGIGQAIRGVTSGGMFPAATLHVVTESIDADGNTVRTPVDYAGTGFVSDWKSDVAARRGYPANTAKIVLVQSATLPKPKLGDEVTAIRPITNVSERYRVTDVTSDPADAMWQVAGVKV